MIINVHAHARAGNLVDPLCECVSEYERSPDEVCMCPRVLTEQQQWVSIGTSQKRVIAQQDMAIELALPLGQLHRHMHHRRRRHL